MSWITKAESILNNIDQRAASVLQQQMSQAKADEEEIKNSSSSQQQTIIKNNSTKNLLGAIKRSKNDDWDSMSEKSEVSKHTVIEDESYQIKNSHESLSKETDKEILKELSKKNLLLSEARLEIEELKQELESLQQKTTDSSQDIDSLIEENKFLAEEKRDILLMNTSLENSNTAYIKTISEMEANLMKTQKNEIDLKQKLEFSQKELSNLQTELQNYRLRATNQLQMKEKLIEQLKNGSSESDPDSEQSTYQIENEQLRSEKEHLQSDLNLLTERLNDSKKLIEKMDHKTRMIVADFENKTASLNETINQFNMQCQRYEDEVRLQKQENAHVRDEMLKQKTSMATKLHEKENELKRLKNFYRQSQANVETENRLQSLTNSLISKQNNLEAITAERNALKLQLEKLTIQHEEMIKQLRSQRPQMIINMNETDDVKSSIGLLSINPFDSRVSRRVKKAYSNLDQLGIRFGVFLRRYPLARIFSVFYVCFLHLFVLLVLLQSTPS